MPLPVQELLAPELPVDRSQAPVGLQKPVEWVPVRRRRQELRGRQTQVVLQVRRAPVQKLVAPVVRQVPLHPELVRRTALPVLVRMPVALPVRLVPDRTLVAPLVPLVLDRRQEVPPPVLHRMPVVRQTVAPENFHTALRRLVAVA